MIKLTDGLDRWREAGLIDAAQATAIAAFETQREGSGDGGRTEAVGLSANEVLAYAGAVVALAGVGFLLSTQGQQLGVTGRVLVLAALTVLALGFGLFPGFGRASPTARRARSGALTLGVVTAGFLTYEVLTDAKIPGSPDGSAADGMVGALVAAGLAAVLLLRNGAGLLAVALAGSLFAAVPAGLQWRHVEGTWGPWFVVALAGALLVLMAELQSASGRFWATEILRTIAVAIPTVTAFGLASDNHLPLELLGGALAVAAFAGSVLRSSGGYAIAGGLGLFAFVLDIGLRHFRDSLGFPVILIASGLVLLAIGFFLSRLLPRLAANPLSTG